MNIIVKRDWNNHDKLICMVLELAFHKNIEMKKHDSHRLDKCNYSKELTTVFISKSNDSGQLRYSDHMQKWLYI